MISTEANPCLRMKEIRVGHGNVSGLEEERAGVSVKVTLLEKRMATGSLLAAEDETAQWALCLLCECRSTELVGLPVNLVRYWQIGKSSCYWRVGH